MAAFNFAEVILTAYNQNRARALEQAKIDQNDRQFNSEMEYKNASLRQDKIIADKNLSFLRQKWNEGELANVQAQTEMYKQQGLAIPKELEIKKNTLESQINQWKEENRLKAEDQRITEKNVDNSYRVDMMNANTSRMNARTSAEGLNLERQKFNQETENYNSQTVFVLDQATGEERVATVKEMRSNPNLIAVQQVSESLRGTGSTIATTQDKDGNPVTVEYPSEYTKYVNNRIRQNIINQRTKKKK